jgi:hypothetical protein
MLLNKIYFNLEKPFGEQKGQEAAGGTPEKESTQKQESSAQRKAWSSQPKEQHKKLVEPAPRSVGGDTRAGPSQQPKKAPVHVAGMGGGRPTVQPGTSNISSFVVLHILFLQ